MTAPASIRPESLPIEERPESYFNRELSWLRFNERVLEEALDERTPLLERVNFLSIFGTNLDEFFMIRVSGLRRQMEAGVIEAPPDGMTPAEQLLAIRDQLSPVLSEWHRCWKDLEVELGEEGIHLVGYDELKTRQRQLLREYFRSQIFPVLTPLAQDPGHPFPHISNLSINLAVVVSDEEHGERFARLKVPQSFPRLLRIPDEERAARLEQLGLEEVTAPNFVWLEEVISANLDLLFPGVEIKAVYPFRITRDADMDIEEDEASDLMLAMSEYVEQRRFGTAIRLEIDEAMPEHIEDILVQNLRIARFQVYRTSGPIGLADVRQLTKIDRPDLKYQPFLPKIPVAFQEDSIFAAIRRRNLLLYHPYDSFNPVVSFVRDAAEDEKVLAIKATLYRVGPNSPIVDALMRARENGKQVAVLVELKARFDERNNITWARQLERHGVHVVYGVVGLKTHSKICLVVRREREGIRRYVHLATGNYNPITARIYTDLGYFTCDPDIADDASDLFNALTGISRKTKYRKLLVAPNGLREGLLSRIEREIRVHQERGGGGRMVFKCNALTDKAMIMALYRASRAGVSVDLQIRGICCLRPGVEGLSENIRVTSIVGRFLEHPRIYFFDNGGEQELLLGSADLMGRNLDRRVETVFPVEDKNLLAAIRDDILELHLRDTAQCRELKDDGSWHRRRPDEGQAPLSSQQHLLDEGGGWRQVLTGA
ncbi:MAG TPA: polyphosphate kinase 1 [Polyangiaceae bacterium]|nr:polyphosphate kinase 1 [Polyangiaceae bacterium]